MLNADDLTADDLTAVLAWLHDRIGHTFTVSEGDQELAGAILRCREPALRSRDDSSYVVDVFVHVRSITIDRHQLHDVHVLNDGELLQLTLRAGPPLEIIDKG